MCESVSIKVGDKVWVKPPDAGWVVTSVQILNNVSVDGDPKPIFDVQHVACLSWWNEEIALAKATQKTECSYIVHCNNYVTKVLKK